MIASPARRPFCATCIRDDRALLLHEIDGRNLLLCSRCSGADELMSELSKYGPLHGAPLLGEVAAVINRLGEVRTDDIAAALGRQSKAGRVTICKALRKLLDVGAIEVTGGKRRSKYTPPRYRRAA